MKRVIKKTAYTFFFLLIALVTLVYIVLNNNTFQNWITGRVTDYLGSKFKTKITIGHINYHPFTSFSLDHVYFGDQKNDTLFYVDNLKFNLGGFKFDSLKLSLNDVTVTGGYCKITTYKDSTYNIDVLDNIKNKADTVVDPLATKFKLYFNKVTCINTRFRYTDSLAEFEKEGFDGLNQDFQHIDLSVKNFWIISDSLNFELKKLACSEKSGLKLKNLKCFASIAPSGMYFTGIDVNTEFSHITHAYSMKFNGWDDLSDYYEKVQMSAALENTRLDMRDVAYFIPYFNGKKQIFTVNGTMKGNVKSLKFKNLDLNFGKETRFKGNANFKGLPEIEETFIDVTAEDALTSREDLVYLLGNILPDELSRLGKMKFKGHYTGFYNDFVAFGHFNSKLGEIESDLNMKFPNSTDDATYSGKMELVNFDIGTLAGIKKYVGQTSLKVAIDGKGFLLKNHYSVFKSDISNIYVNGYNYRNISINGKVDKKIFAGKLNMNDPNASLDFNGTIDLHSDMKKFKFNASVNDANLMALKLTDKPNIFSTDIDIDFDFKNIDNNNGSIIFRDILFVKDGINYPLNELRAISKSENENRQMRIKSEILDAELDGNYSLADMTDNIRNIMSSLFPNYITDVKRKLQAEEFTYKINMINSDWLSDVFFPDLHIYDMNVEGKIATLNKNISLNAVVSSIKYKEFGVKNLAVKYEVKEGKTGHLLLGVDQSFYKDSLMLRDFAMLSDFSVNRANSHIKISDTSGVIHADVFSEINFEKDRQAGLRFTGLSNVTIKHKLFNISDSGEIITNDSQLFCKDVKITHGKGEVKLAGFYDFNDAHNLKADVSNIDISLADIFYPGLTVRPSGTINGTFILKGNNHKNYLNTFCTLNNFAIDNDTLGDFSITTNYTEKQQRFLMYAKSLSGKLKNFEAGGFVSTSGDDQLGIDITLDQTEISSFQALFRNQVYFYNGLTSGKCRLSGTLNKIQMNGELDFSKVDMKVEYLKTRYKFTSHINFDNDIVRITPFTIIDDYGRTASISGKITHKEFSGFRFDLSASKLDHFFVLNTNVKDNSLFYGTAYASGSVSLSGAANDLLLETNLHTNKGTRIYVPLSSDSETGEDGFINFINKDTSIKVFVARKSTLPGFQLSSVIHANPDAEIFLIINEQTGDIMKGRGAGTIKLELTRQGQFNMYGQITIEEGEYRFTAANLFTKKYLLSKGGTIEWTGNPMHARMDIQGVYFLRKVSIAEIVNSPVSGNSIESKIPVECLLYVRGNLSAPEIKFDLNFPDLQSTIGSNSATEIQNAVRTLRAEPDLMNQQVMSLMLFGKFVPVSGYNTTSNTNLQSGAATTLSELLTAQANRLIGNIVPGLDFNIDYQAGRDIIGNSRAIFSASKKFYNNRLEIQTSYDPFTASNASSAANLANVTTQYSISKDGNLKIKAYSRNTTDPILGNSNIRNTLTQGVGLYYRKEFDTFIELFNKKK